MHKVRFGKQLCGHPLFVVDYSARDSCQLSVKRIVFFSATDMNFAVLLVDW